MRGPRRRSPIGCHNMALPNILHVDLDAFFASVEQVLQPALKGRPVIVGSEHETKGVVASASYEARACGVRAAMPVFQARRLCPHGVYLAGHHGEYARFSEDVFDLLEQISPAVERASLDEGYVDLGGCQRLYGAWSARPAGRMPFSNGIPGLYLRREDRAVPPRERTSVPEHYRWIAAVALRIKRSVKARTGLNVSVGCAANKLAAKSASDFAKPNGVALVEPGHEADFFLNLPLDDLPGLGGAVLDKLRKWNVRNVLQARRLPLELLEGGFGECHGRAIYRVLRGQVPDPPDPRRRRSGAFFEQADHQKSISRVTTFWTASSDYAFVEGMLLHLSERVGRALRRDGLAGRTVTLKLRYQDFTTLERSRSAREPVCLDEEIFAIARTLLRGRWCRSRRLRLVGVGLSRLQPARRLQRTLFDDDTTRYRRIDRCLDGLRDRFGFEVIQRGPTINLAEQLDPVA